MPLICLSYSDQTSTEANAVRAWLAENGWNTPSAEPKSETSWDEDVERCEAVLVLVSRGWLGDERLRARYWRARHIGKPVFCALVDALPVEDLPAWLTASRPIIALSPEGADGPLGRGRDQTAGASAIFSIDGLDALKAALGRSRVAAHTFAWPPQDEPDRAPYRGLAPLEATDAGVFFGRDRELVEALDALRALAERGPGRFFVVVGEAGAGKSSFLRAGLAPRLARDGERFYPLPAIRAEGGALLGPNGLASAISVAAQRCGRALSEAHIREAVATGGEALRRALDDLSRRDTDDPAMGKSAPSLVLLIDQAEDLLGDEEGQRLLAVIAELAIADHPAVIFVLAIRPSGYDALQHAGLFREMRPQLFALPRMSPDAYRSVIKGPAERLPLQRRLEIEPAVSEALLEDIDRNGGAPLPLLAFALQTLYRLCAYEKRIQKADYEKCGRLSGTFDAAIGRVLAIAGADPGTPRDRDARLALLRRGLLPWLACGAPGSGAARRRRARMREIPLDSLPLIELLVEERLVTRGVDPASNEATFELAHDVLLDRWKLLADWIAEEPRLDDALQRLQRAAADWDAHARSAEWAKHGGAELHKAESLYARPEYLTRLGATDRAYLIACREKEKASRKTDVLLIPEEERAARKSDYARRESQRTRRSAAFAWVAFATALVAIGLAGWLWPTLPQGERDAAAKLKQSETTIATAIDSINRTMDGLAKKLAGEAESQAALLVDMFDQLYKLQEQLAAYPAQSEELRRSQSVALNHISEALLAKGDAEAARAAARRSVAIMEALAASRPGDAGWLRDLSVAHEKLGDAQAASGDLSGARKSYGDDLTIAKRLVSASPGDARRRWDLSVSYEKLGDVQAAQGDLDGALDSYGNDRAIREALTTQSPGAQGSASEAWRRGLAVSYEKMGAALAKRQDVKQAIAAFEGALEIYQTLPQAGAQSQTALYAVVPHWWLADLDKSKSRAHLDAALAILQPLAEAGRLSDEKRKWMSEIKAARLTLDEGSSVKR